MDSLSYVKAFGKEDPECQLQHRTPRLGCGSPKPGVITDSYKVQNTGQGYTLPQLVPGVTPRSGLTALSG